MADQYQQPGGAAAVNEAGQMRSDLPSANADGTRVLALIPAYNAAAHVAGVVRAARAHLPVLVVDDGSTDLTGQEAEAGGALVRRQEPNQGKGAALQHGLRWALAEGYEAVLTLDADGQHDPSEIPAFLACYARTRSELIIGARDFSRMPLVRRVANTIGRWAFSWALGRSVRDNQSGYRLLHRRLIELVLASQERGYEFEMDMIVTAVRHGLRVESVPIRTIYADEESHIRPLAHVAHFARMVWQTRRALRQR
ncbi:MAG TPA: glycosyltransferase family 2 protein [Longimicrobiaceae bacterium]|nr:glycosyltransferase family 2 protein [Longimicrobiaceae bacterium]